MVWFLWPSPDPQDQWLCWILNAELPEHVAEFLADMRSDGSFASFEPIMLDIHHWVRIIEKSTSLPLTEHWGLIKADWTWCEKGKCYKVATLQYSVQFGSNGPVTRFWHVGG